MRHLVAALGILAGLGDQAAADELPDAGKSALVVPFTGSGSDSDRLQLALAAIRGVRSAKLKAELAQTSAADLIAINGCAANDSDCLATLPAALGVDVVVFGKVSGEGDERSVVLVRIEADRRSRSSGRTSAIESQAAALFGVEVKGANKAPPAGSDKASDDDAFPFSGGYTGDLGGRGTLEDGDRTAAPANYGRRDGRRLEFDQVERYSWGLAIGGGAAIVVGAVLLVISDSVQGSIDDAPTDTADQLDDLESLEGRAKVLTGFGNALAISGLVTAAVGGALVLVQASRDRPESAPVAAPTVGVAPVRGGAVITFGVRR